MSPEEFAEKMYAISKMPDVQMRHEEADGLICELLKKIGYQAGAEIFDDMAKWYS